MKKVFIICFLSFISVSCTNDDDSNTSVNLVGTWEWIQSTGGITGSTLTPASTGMTMQLEISNTTIRSITDGTLVSENTYTIETRETMFGNVQEVLVVGDGIGQIIFLEGNTLELIGDCSDCFTSEYLRIN